MDMCPDASVHIISQPNQITKTLGGPPLPSFNLIGWCVRFPCKCHEAGVVCSIGWAPNREAWAVAWHNKFIIIEILTLFMGLDSMVEIA